MISSTNSLSFTDARLSRNQALASGGNGPPARPRRQPAAELRHGGRANRRVGRRRTQSGGRVARRNGPVARSTQPRIASFRFSELTQLKNGEQPGDAETAEPRRKKLTWDSTPFSEWMAARGLCDALRSPLPGVRSVLFRLHGFGLDYSRCHENKTDDRDRRPRASCLHRDRGSVPWRRRRPIARRSADPVEGAGNRECRETKW